MVQIPAAPSKGFWMGDIQGGGGIDEKSKHRVKINYSFQMSKYEVTFDEWHECVKDKKDGNCRAGDNFYGTGRKPVIGVSWDEVQTYINWLNKKKGYTEEKIHYRLPTEAEWEYAARGGSDKKYWWGNQDPVCGQGVKNGVNFSACSGSGTTIVGSYGLKNGKNHPWGLYDMHGNVWEWVQDCWHSNYNDAPDDGSAWGKDNGGNCGSRVLRGGSWNDYPFKLRSAYRDRGITSGRDIGFRLVLSSHRIFMQSTMSLKHQSLLKPWGWSRENYHQK